MKANLISNKLGEGNPSLKTGTVNRILLHINFVILLINFFKIQSDNAIDFPLFSVVSRKTVFIDCHGKWQRGLLLAI
ncbi:hypothetical protein VV97_02960 [Vibrio vulnificus]|nr:hypothetical protein VV97_02960 [Vibrio vulnificus]